MGLNRESIVKPNVAANLDATRSNNIFTKVPDNSTVRYRFLPTNDPDGRLWYTAAQHFKMKEAAEEAGEKPRGIAPACNNYHGEGDCYLCKLNVTLKRHGDSAEKEIGKSIYANPRFNAQVLIAEVAEDKSLKYRGPFILGLPKGASDTISQLLANMDKYGQPDFADVKQGQDLIITTTGGSGLSKRYSIDRSADLKDLDVIFPEWEEKFIEDMNEKQGLRIMTNEEMKQAAMFTFGDQLDWEELASSFGL